MCPGPVLPSESEGSLQGCSPFYTTLQAAPHLHVYEYPPPHPTPTATHTAALSSAWIRR